MLVDEKTDFREIARDGGLVLSYRAGDFIFREGDTASCMYIVLKGSVEMSTREKVVVTILEGKPFGMLSLIDKKPRANNARAKEDCDLALLDGRTFRVMIEETPGFLWYVINDFAARPSPGQRAPVAGGDCRTYRRQTVELVMSGETTATWITPT
jgi:CRP-like cAMP-binding protein